MKFRVTIYKNREAGEELTVKDRFTDDNFDTIDQCHEHYANKYQGHDLAVGEVFDGLSLSAVLQRDNNKHKVEATLNGLDKSVLGVGRNTQAKFFEKYFPEIEDCYEWVVVFPKKDYNFFVRMYDWAKEDEHADTIYAVRVGADNE